MAIKMYQHFPIWGREIFSQIRIFGLKTNHLATLVICHDRWSMLRASKLFIHSAPLEYIFFCRGAFLFRNAWSENQSKLSCWSCHNFLQFETQIEGAARYRRYVWLIVNKACHSIMYVPGFCLYLDCVQIKDLEGICTYWIKYGRKSHGKPSKF
jgi:hypothetical protein